MVNRIGSLKLFRWKNDRPSLDLTLPGYVWDAPKLRYGWEPFFVGHFGHDRTVFTYRKPRSV